MIVTTTKLISAGVATVSLTKAGIRVGTVFNISNGFITVTKLGVRCFSQKVIPWNWGWGRKWDANPDTVDTESSELTLFTRRRTILQKDLIKSGCLARDRVYKIHLEGINILPFYGLWLYHLKEFIRHRDYIFKKEKERKGKKNAKGLFLFEHARFNALFIIFSKSNFKANFLIFNAGGISDRLQNDHAGLIVDLCHPALFSEEEFIIYFDALFKGYSQNDISKNFLKFSKFKVGKKESALIISSLLLHFGFYLIISQKGTVFSTDNLSIKNFFFLGFFNDTASFNLNYINKVGTFKKLLNDQSINLDILRNYFKYSFKYIIEKSVDNCDQDITPVIVLITFRQTYKGKFDFVSFVNLIEKFDVPHCHMFKRYIFLYQYTKKYFHSNIEVNQSAAFFQESMEDYLLFPFVIELYAKSGNSNFVFFRGQLILLISSQKEFDAFDNLKQIFDKECPSFFKHFNIKIDKYKDNERLRFQYQNQWVTYKYPKEFHINKDIGKKSF